MAAKQCDQSRKPQLSTRRALVARLGCNATSMQSCCASCICRGVGYQHAAAEATDCKRPKVASAAVAELRDPRAWVAPVRPLAVSKAAGDDELIRWCAVARLGCIATQALG